MKNTEQQTDKSPAAQPARATTGRDLATRVAGPLGLFKREQPLTQKHLTEFRGLGAAEKLMVIAEMQFRARSLLIAPTVAILVGVSGLLLREADWFGGQADFMRALMLAVIGVSLVILSFAVRDIGRAEAKKSAFETIMKNPELYPEEG